MSFKTWITSNIAARITSEAEQTRRRTRAERRRAAAGRPHRIDYFHQTDDPYSHLSAQLLPLLLKRYEVELVCHIVSAPPDWAAPERDRLTGHSRIDAARLAVRSGLRFADLGRQPSADRISKARMALARALETKTFVAAAADIGDALWSEGGSLPAGSDATAELAKGDELRQQLGHYLGGVFHYAGEWHWGVDRLHYLEERLAALGARRDDAPQTLLYPQPISPRPDAIESSGGALDFFLSFRSPYTYIAAERTKALADAYGATVNLRFVLPMVMRGLPVPPAKRNYITLDAAREARRAGVAFGRIADPVGAPVERGYSLLPWAISQGRGFEYALSFMRAVWSQGVDAGSDAGLRRIVDSANLDWAAARSIVGNDGWRVQAEANRRELLELGLWGVPCFRYGDVATWGQDRLWVIEDAMRKGPKTSEGETRR